MESRRGGAGGRVQSTGFSLLGDEGVGSRGFSPSLNALTSETTEDLEQRSRNQIPPSYPPASGGKAPSPLAGRVGEGGQSCPKNKETMDSGTEMVRGGGDWLDQRASENLLLRARVLRSPSTGPLPILEPQMRF